MAVALLKKLEQTDPAVDMLKSWQFAEARAYHTLLPRDKLAGLTQGLHWSPIRWEFRTAHNWGLSFIYPFDKGRGFWMAKTFDLPPGWKGEQLIFKYGVTEASSANASSANVWINGEPLGGMWQWPDGNIIIPERVMKKGGENRITWLIQPPPSQEWGQLATSPSVSADLSRSAFIRWAGSSRTRLFSSETWIPLSAAVSAKRAAWEERRYWEECCTTWRARWSCHLTAGGSPRDTNSERSGCGTLTRS